MIRNIPFRPAPNITLYRALYSYLREAILSGKLPSAMKLPSSRSLAEELNLSRNTVLNAYRQLLTEGYLHSKQGSGTFVTQVLPDSLLVTARITVASTDGQKRKGPIQPILSHRAKAQVTASQQTPGRKLCRPFYADTPALDAFPYKLWSRLVIRQARQMNARNFAYQDSAGYRPLCEAIAAHITITRQVHCTADQVLIVSGAQAALDLAARMLVNDGESVWMEDPGYLGARGAFLGSGAHIVPVPIDGKGLVVSVGVQRAPKARLVYVTPSHQFPLGVTMPISRRLELLDWAKCTNAYILEDDYDSEFRFAERPLATIQSLDNADRVIYIGTFSKVLFPSIRIGYLILPSPLIASFLKVRRLIDTHSPMLEQLVLTEFINEGHYVRHLRRMRTLYAERRSVLLDATHNLPLEIYSPEAGIHCVGWLPDEIDEAELMEKAVKYDLGLTPISRFSLRPLRRRGLLLGYGGYSAQEIRNGARRLGALLSSL
ncbi:MAG TPA: PLP-dependent aminotransferase family protein [Anaerolineales bacterium]|nr:PLP-dependent aminotransferase family protein [Anaerolineales bacterium]